MSTIYEDIQALRERFKSEYGLEVDIHVSAHSTCNGELKGYPWFKFWDQDNQIEIVLHR